MQQLAYLFAREEFFICIDHLMNAVDILAVNKTCVDNARYVLYVSNSFMYVMHVCYDINCKTIEHLRILNYLLFQA